MENTSILIWNGRGLNDRGRRGNLRKVVDDFRPSVVCLQETKVTTMSQHLFLLVFGTTYDKFVDLPANDTRGGVLIAWKGNSCQAIASRVDTYSASVLFSEQEGRNWWFTGVYGPQGDD